MSVDIAYVLSHGFAARTVLHTQVIDELLAHGATVAVVAPNADEPYFQDLCKRKGVTLFQAPKVDNRLLAMYGPLRRYLFEDFQNNAALRAKHLYETHQPSVHPVIKAQALVGHQLNSLLLRAPIASRTAKRIEEAALRHSGVRQLLKTINPRVLVSTYPVNWLEALCVKEAARMGIHTVGQLLSWDNISCKGHFAALAQSFVSWGPIMTSELRQYYNVADNLIDECGVAHFDKHLDEAASHKSASYLKTLGLDPHKPYLFFGMSASFFCPHEIDVVEWLAQQVMQDRFGETMQLLVRPHPQNVRGHMANASVFERINALKSPRVAIDIPKVVSDKLLWDLEEDDLMRLSALLEGCTVSLNSGSTLTIDSLMHNKPVVLPLFDAGYQLPWWTSVRRVAEFPHLAKLLAFKGARVVESFAALESAITQYIREPDLDESERRQACEAECGKLDGRATQRIAHALLKRAGIETAPTKATKATAVAPQTNTKPSANSALN